jgi:hypothetical protein
VELNRITPEIHNNIDNLKELTKNIIIHKMVINNNTFKIIHERNFITGSFNITYQKIGD